MRTFIFGYDRFETMTTSRLLEDEGIDHAVLCHTEEAKEKFISGGSARPERLVATGQPKGLANNRNAALEMMDDGEWALFLVDDLKNVTTVSDYWTRTDTRLRITMNNQKQIGPTTKQPATMRNFMAAAYETVAACEAMGAHLGGFCCIDNPVFRDVKWKFNVFADGRAWVVKKGNIYFDTNAQLNDDMAWTARNIQHYGVVVVNQWVLPTAVRYGPGAYGSMEQRMPQKIAEAKYLVEKYPGLIRYAKKAGWPNNSHMQLRRTLTPVVLRNLETLASAVSNDYRSTHPQEA